MHASAIAELPTSPHFRLQRLAEGVYAAIAEPGGDAGSNAGIVDLGGQTLIFDTFLTPAAARELRHAAEQLTGRSVGCVVNSHWHNDHVHGNATVAMDNPAVELISTEATRDLIAARAAANLAEIRAEVENAELAAKLTDLTLRLPTLTFASRLVFHGAQRSAELLTYGGGHTASDAFLLLPEERIAFLGDLAFVRAHPWLGDGDPDELTRILERIEALDIAVVVPGHGPVGDLTDCASVRAYVAAIGQRARALHARGVPLAEAQAAPIPEPFARWSGAETFQWNMEFFYEGLGQNAQEPQP